MAKVNTNKNKPDEKLLDLVEVQQKTKSFFEHNQKLISIAGGGLILLVGGLLAYFLLYQQPRQKRAIEQMMLAEQQFEKDSFRLALTNPGGGYSGFLDIIETYSGTKSANLAKYYAGICYLHLGQHDAAIEFLNDYNAKDEPTNITRLGTIGDAYSEKKDFSNAISFYKKAIAAGNNELLTPYYIKKLGMLYLYQKDMPGGLAEFKKLKSDFPLSPESTDVDKYISQAGGGIED
ncbi:MAG: tetratricopeptide repeat protein [Saprospiraceae bacterium]|jgi:tetratricopeptide (TPR) repeat protein|nr:tetratricopeptide repeat protein [Saprospiraceae bacterium]MBK7370839.1 tetratricopeptide repeat protein [Saprospiraceae bacterium]MBK7436615.1 tetratricopeptide repeat protein [Saprospiraceae bacterium]MBK7609351.1 tetratricopeptide repeat protein [Saprospiraceae bacterium]MBK8279415.1 tetratricopeptide repeat protein [Saprospiraceae bacterium]